MRCSRFDKAVFALEELVLLFPSNSFFVLQLAETLYTAGDLARAYKTFLRVLEMNEGGPIVGGASAGESVVKASGERTEGAGALLRALWGLKMVSLDWSM